VFVLIAIMVSGTILPDVFAEESSYTFDYYPGSLRFDANLEDVSCDALTPNPITKTGSSLNIDEMDDHFFITLGKTDSGEYHYLQINLPDNGGKEHLESYVLDFKKQGKVVYGGLYQDYPQLAVYIETDVSSLPMDENSYKRFFIGESKNITHQTDSLDPGDYDLHAILFQSDRTNWIGDEICAISLNWPITIDGDGNIIPSQPQTSVGRIYPIETDSDALSETDRIIEHADKAQSDETSSLVHDDMMVKEDSTVTKLEWSSTSYRAPGIGVLHVVDPDMNLNQDRIDAFNIQIWSDSDARGVDLTVIETGDVTGIFKGTVTFTVSDESSGDRLRVSHADVITAEYLDSVSSSDPNASADNPVIITAKSVIKELPVSPLKQQMSGILPQDVMCKEGLEKIFRHNGSGVCTKPLTVEKLIHRGYGTMISN